MAGGVSDKYVYSRKVNFRTLKTVELAGNIVDAEAMIVLSHGKGHGHSGFGGAIKNIAMGCVDGETRGKIHRLMSAAFEWDASKCTGCLLCRDNCPNEAITFKDGKIEHLRPRTASTACTASSPARRRPSPSTSAATATSSTAWP